MIALDPSDQSVVWRYIPRETTSTTQSSSPIALDSAGNAYFTTTSMYSVSPTGRTRWTFSLSGTQPAAPMVIGLTVYVLAETPGRSPDTLTAVSTSGRQRWSVRLQGGWSSYDTALGPGAQGTILAPSGPGLQAFSTSTGRVEWSFSTGAAPLDIVTDANGTAYVITGPGSPGTVTAVSPGGQQMWSASTPSSVGNMAVSFDGSLYVGGSPMTAFQDP